jgi:predicted nucleic acid-binding protein
LALVTGSATVVEVAGDIAGVATHPEDDRILETALTGRCGYLVTGDKQLQGLKDFAGVTIVSPRQFGDLLLTDLFS